MGFYARAHFTDKWKYMTGRQDRACIHCSKTIPKAEKRIVLHTNSFFCFHVDCFKLEYLKTRQQDVEVVLNKLGVE